MFQLFGMQTREVYFQLHSNKLRMHFDAAFEGVFELGEPSSLCCDAFLSSNAARDFVCLISHTQFMEFCPNQLMI